MKIISSQLFEYFHLKNKNICTPLFQIRIRTKKKQHGGRARLTVLFDEGGNKTPGKGIDLSKATQLVRGSGLTRPKPS
jgi:hypothetical protein